MNMVITSDKVIELMKTYLVPKPYRQRGLAGAALWLYKCGALSWTEFQRVRDEQMNK